MNLYIAFYDMDTNYVYAWMTDRSIVTIDCDKVEEAFADNMYERSELDDLLFNDPTAYADLVLNDDPGRYLKAVTQYRIDETMM
ncbi:MAG: hypothetical protein IJ189_13630 [Clostridia bacterium]|nr:hypothetical protein [Clostridia bacterium]